MSGDSVLPVLGASGVSGVSGAIGKRRRASDARPLPSVRAVLLLAGVMVVATVVAASALLVDLRQKEIAHARGEMASLTRVLAEQTTRSVEGVALTLHAARDRLSDERGLALGLDSELVHLLLRVRSAGLPQVKSIFVADAQGLGVNSSRPDFIRRLPMHEREFFSHFAVAGGDELFISRPEKARVDGQWTYYASLRLQDGAGRLRGVLVAAISIEYFESLYASIGLDAVRRIALLDRQGVLLAGHPHDEEMFGRPLAGLQTLRRIDGGPAGAVSEAVEELDSGRRYVAYRQVEKYPLLVSASVDENEALTPWRGVMRPLVVGTGVVLLFVLLTTFLVVRSLLRRAALEAELRESDERLRHMVQSARDAIVTVDADKRIVLFNGAAEAMFGITAKQAIGQALDDLLARGVRAPRPALLDRCLDADSPSGGVSLGMLSVASGEREFPVELSVSTTTFRGQTLFTLVLRDLSESQRTERELIESNRQLKELSASLQQVREEARARIARELHDELGQLLTGIRMEVSWIGGRLRPEQQVLIDKVVSLKTQIDQTIASVRRIASDLRPLVLDDLGLAAATSWYVDQFSARTGLPVKLDLPPEDAAPDDAVATALFRVLQESLTNVARHARASRVEVGLACADGVWTLRVTDDGGGFAHDPRKLGHMGLVGMRERARMLGGRFVLTTAPGAGTAIEVVVPAQSRKEDDGKTQSPAR